MYYLSVRVVSLAVGSLHHSLNKMTPRRAGLTKFRSPAARYPYKLPFGEFLEVPHFFSAARFYTIRAYIFNRALRPRKRAGDSYPLSVWGGYGRC